MTRWVPTGMKASKLEQLWQQQKRMCALTGVILYLCVLQHSQRLLWGFYTLRYHPPDALLAAIAKRLTPALYRMEISFLSKFIWAFGGLDYEPSNMHLLCQLQSSSDFTLHAVLL